MKRYLLVFDRSVGELIQSSEFESVGDALKARMVAEQHYAERGDVEVVVLTSDSEEGLRRTHSRYFGITTSR